jgi:radical SAM protein with 4Fe4S-binding SPASM domain
MESVGRLLEAGLATSIRLNLDLYNAENLMLLVDELAARFGGKQGFSIYAHHLFDGEIAIGDYHTDEEWGLRFEAMHRLNSKIEGYGLRRIKGIRKHLKTVQCMVDHGGSLVIAPTGDIGLCEHYSDSRFVGHLDQEKLDAEAVKAWRELSPQIPACAECIWYPDCIRLKNCTLASVCFRHELEEELRSTKESMVQEFKLWKEKAQKEDCEDEILC